MKRPARGLVIRTAFNNQGWVGRCKNPLSDVRCFKCREGELYINKRKPIEEDENGVCIGETEEYPLSDPRASNVSFWCWEQVLCKKYFWGNIKGKWRQVEEGMPVYFVCVEPDRTLTLWGHSVIDRVDNELERYPAIYCKPFKPMPEDKWVKELTGDEITGRKWGQLNFRYLDEVHETYLASLVEGKQELRRKAVQPLTSYEELNVGLNRDIIEKLEKIANNEGREVKELIREAVAKLIRERS